MLLFDRNYINTWPRFIRGVLHRSDYIFCYAYEWENVIRLSKTVDYFIHMDQINQRYFITDLLLAKIRRQIYIRRHWNIFDIVQHTYRIIRMDVR